MYKTRRHLSTRLAEKKKTKKRQSEPFMHPVTPRGTQCDTLEIIAAYCFLTHNCYKVERKGSTLSILARTLVTFHVLEKACANVLGMGGHQKNVHCCLKWGITEARFLLK